MATLYRKAPAAEDRAASAARAAESPEEELARLRRENATLREIAELRAQNEALRAGLVEAPAHAIPAARAKVDDDSQRERLSAREFRESYAARRRPGAGQDTDNDASVVEITSEELVEAPAHAIPAARAKVDDVDSRRVGHPRQLSARAFRQSKTLSAHAFAEFQEAETALAAKAAGPLPGGYAVGDRVYLLTGSYTFRSGIKLTHGQAGKVKGSSVRLTRAAHAARARLEPNNPKYVRAHNARPERVAVMFPGNSSTVNCLLTCLSRTPPPPLPGAFELGDKVFLAGGSQTFTLKDGQTPKVTRPGGQVGEVTGLPPSDCPAFGKGVDVMFPGKTENSAWANASCYIKDLSHHDEDRSRAPPASPPPSAAPAARPASRAHPRAAPRRHHHPCAVGRAWRRHASGIAPRERAGGSTERAERAGGHDAELEVAEFQKAEAALAQAAGPLPGGCAAGDKVLLAGSHTFKDGRSLRTVRPARWRSGASSKRHRDSSVRVRAAVMFPGTETRGLYAEFMVNCLPATLSRRRRHCRAGSKSATRWS